MAESGRQVWKPLLPLERSILVCCSLEDILCTFPTGRKEALSLRISTELWIGFVSPSDYMVKMTLTISS